jgi:hypothetical protein
MVAFLFIYPFINLSYSPFLTKLSINKVIKITLKDRVIKDDEFERMWKEAVVWSEVTISEFSWMDSNIYRQSSVGMVGPQAEI